MLQQLVAARLLRSDHRSDSSYYELSHDALIEPVLATRRTTALLFGWVGLVTTSLFALLLGLVIVIGLVVSATAKAGELYASGILLLAILLIPMMVLLLGLSRRNLRSLRRFRHRTMDELQDLSSRKSAANAVYGSLAAISGGFLLFVALLAAVADILVMSGRATLIGPEPYWLAVEQSVARVGLGLDTLATLIGMLFLALLGLRMLRWGIRKLVGAPTAVRPQASVAASSTRSSRWLGFDTVIVVCASCGLVSVLVLVVGSVIEFRCAHGMQQVPDWVSAATNYMAADCWRARTGELALWEIIGEGMLNVLIAFEAGRWLLRRGTTLRARIGRPAETVEIV